MRATATLPCKLERNLLTYATAASAAGIGVLALAPVAESKVIYTSDRIVIEIGQPYHLDFNQDGVAEFIFLRTRNSLSGGGYYNHLLVRGAVVAGGRGLHGRNALALQHGEQIYRTRAFANYANMAYSKVTSSGRHFTSGYWINVTDGYLGLKFNIESKIHYGWARLTVQFGRFQTKAVLTGYAYETIPDKAIIAGNRGSTTGAGPEAEPASLGHLALGAAGKRVHPMKTK